MCLQKSEVQRSSSDSCDKRLGFMNRNNDPLFFSDCKYLKKVAETIHCFLQNEGDSEEIISYRPSCRCFVFLVFEDLQYCQEIT